MSRRDDISLQSGSSGSSRSSYSSSGYNSSGYSGSSSRRGAVERHINKNDNIALRLAQHCLQGPFAKRSTSNSHHHHHHHHKKHGSNYSSSSSSSSYKSSNRHHRDSRSDGYFAEPHAAREQFRPQRGPQPPPQAGGWHPGVRPGQYAARPGFDPSYAARQAAQNDPIWSSVPASGARRGHKGRRAVLVGE